ncbi:unnamed protein product [Adineta ricciae]|uniref:Uncharacterized protein n=1 Tax=Adineta ricciae TaxID=249248 RepID=A0A814KNU6_ADIRI|nr:unnamed protein product [Adineta ricciae]CAF1423242.1 unnamed protein product [Adineta ricciae]
MCILEHFWLDSGYDCIWTGATSRLSKLLCNIYLSKEYDQDKGEMNLTKIQNENIFVADDEESLGDFIGLK